VGVRHAQIVVAIVGLSLMMDTGAQGTLTLSTGYDYSTGKYGDRVATTIRYIPTYIKYETGPWTTKLTVPYLDMTGPANVIGGGDNTVVTSTGSTQRRSASGLGDVLAAVSYEALNDGATGVVIDVVARVKFPTANAKQGLGTGKTDYALQVDALKAVGLLSLFGTVGYSVLGSSPTLALNNVWFASAGGAYRVLPTTTAGLLYSYRQPASASGFMQSDLTSYISQKLGDRWRLQFYGVVGFAKGSPDWGAGTSISILF